MARTTEVMRLVNSLRHVVAATATAPEPNWRQDVHQRLTGLHHALKEHVGRTEGPDGLYHELVDQAPRLAPDVSTLVRDERALLASVAGLCHRITSTDHGDGGPDSDQVRRWAYQLILELYRHRQRGADLVYEAYETDLGGETG